MTNLSRREALATTGRAAIGVLGLGGLAVGRAADPDPIFAAIEAHRAIHAEWTAILDNPEDARAYNDDLMRRYCERTNDAEWAMLEVESTGVAGVSALLAYVTDHLKHNLIWPERAARDDDFHPDVLLRMPPDWKESHSRDFEADAIAWAARSLAKLQAEGGLT